MSQKGKHSPRHSDPFQQHLDATKQFGTLGWYTIQGWTNGPCPECGVPRGGTPGHHWHLIRENTDDEERIRAAHGEPVPEAPDENEDPRPRLPGDGG